MKLPRLLAVLAATGALLLVPAGTASAHPLGNFTVNHYDGLVAAPGELRVDHVEDLAEIPATQAGPDVERLGLTGWAGQRCAAAARDSEVTVDGRTVPLRAVESHARVRPGQAGLDTLRVECRLTAPLPEGDSVTVGFRSAGADSGPGWREITARGDRTTLTASDVPEQSASRELAAYPEELLSSPADTTSATLRVRPGGPALAEERGDAPAASVLPRGADRFTRALDSLVARQDLTAGFAALALLIAIGLGAMHALAPGHGKTLMAATAAAHGGRARMKDVLPLAASVTVTHTLGVVALGLLVTAGSAAAPSVVAWLGIASGVLVTLAGAGLVRRAVRGRGGVQAHVHAHGHGHAHGDEQGHEHAHDHEHGQEHAHAHDHEHAHAPDHRDHRDHPHAHDHGGHDHPRPHDHSHPRPNAGHAHPLHTHTHTHTHGGHTHSHPVAPTLRGTILMGFAGGMVPSPSAVVVLVGAAALGHAWFGLLLVVAYGVGLALTLTAAGFAVVKFGAGVSRALVRRPRWTSNPLAALVRRTAPVGSAFVVVALGAGLVLRGAASAFG
ncbi:MULTISPECIES: nickel transporter [Streptomyces]|uniref:nickel transporter n=1 Tax=Streptomyces TaxID=1883 RepID=UPI001488D540|nr:nickel transporter [Streptomyces sp. Z423-1]